MFNTRVGAVNHTQLVGVGVCGARVPGLRFCPGSFPRSQAALHSHLVTLRPERAGGESGEGQRRGGGAPLLCLLGEGLKIYFLPIWRSFAWLNDQAKSFNYS